MRRDLLHVYTARIPFDRLLWPRSHTFRDGALLAVNLGEDADATGAVYGQLAGAYYGVGGIPDEWLRVLTRANDIADLATPLHHRATASSVA
jgi:ADP-ribosyl-[dinitrogen reductase] hydrolase